jgi:membrane fusion protein, heavy metal efflux system
MKVTLPLLLAGLATPLPGCSRSDGERKPPAGGAPTRPSPGGEFPAHESEGPEVLRVGPDELRDLRITTTRVEKHAHAEAVEGLAEAQVDGTAYAEVGSPLQASVVSLRVAPGDRVEAGAVLAELRSVELGRARASVFGAGKRLAIALEQVGLLRGLAESRIATQRDLREAELAVAGAEAELRAAEASLQALGAGTTGADSGDDLSRFRLCAPIAGTVLDRRAILGQVATPERPLFRIADLGRIWLAVQVYERDVTRLAVGTSVRARFVALPGREFTGRLEFLDTEIDPVSRVAQVRAVLPNEEGLLRPGMAASAWIAVGGEQAQVLSVPAAAVQRIEGNWCVFVPRGPGSFEARPIARGRDLEGEVEVLRGLEPGEEVVVQGAFVLKAQAEKAHGGGEHGHH